MLRLKSLYVILTFLAVSASAADSVQNVKVGGTIHSLRDFKHEDVAGGVMSALNQTLSPQSLKTDTIIYSSNKEFENAAKNHEIDFIFGTPLEMLAIEKYIDKNSLISGYIMGERNMRLFLLVRKDANIQNLESLANKSIDCPDWLLNDIGGMYLNTSLLGKGLPTYDRFFSNVQKSKNSNQSIINLFFKKNDAALVYEAEFKIAAELNPQLLNQLTVLQTSEYFPSSVAAALKDTDAESVKKVLDAALNFNKSNKGKQILRMINSTGFAKVDYKEMEPVRNLYNKYQQLKPTFTIKQTFNN